jgi:hypothetical protein
MDLGSITVKLWLSGIKNLARLNDLLKLKE